MSEIKVSIIVPVYNVSRYLRRCLDSCVNQTMNEIEVIIVNDCSPDPLDAEIMREYEAEFPDKVRCFWHAENKLPGAARNTGLSAAGGEYLNFVDSDDYIDLRMCEKLYNAAEANNADYVYCDYYKGGKYFNRITELYKYCERNQQITLGIWGCIIRRSLFTENSLYFPQMTKIYDDSIMTQVWLFLAERIHKLPEGLYYYCINQESIVHSSALHYRIFDFYIAFAQMRKLCVDILVGGDLFLFDLQTTANLFEHFFIIYGPEYAGTLPESVHKHNVEMLTESVHKHNIDMLKIIGSIAHDYKRAKMGFLWKLLNSSLKADEIKAQLLEFDILYIKKALEKSASDGKIVVVWGAGERGERMCWYLRKAGISFEVTDVNVNLHGKKGLNVKPWEMLKEHAGVVIVTPRLKFDEIKEQIGGNIPLINMEDILYWFTR